MNASDLEANIRNAPTWLLILIAALLVVVLIAAGPFAGWRLERKRTAPERAYSRAAAAKWIETGEIDLGELRTAERPKLKLKPRTEETINGIRFHDGVSVPLDDSSPVCVISRPDWLVEQLEQAKPSWMTEDTGEWDPMSEVVDAEVVDDDSPPEAPEPEHSFWADQLGSWTLPDELVETGPLPIAREVFDDLVARNWLTGAGADIDVEWASWDLYEGASA